MNEIENKTIELSKLIIESNEYKEFIEAKEKLYKDEELKRRVGEFRTRNFGIQMSNSDNILSDVKNLENEFKDLLRNSIAKEYLDAEMILCRMVQKIDKMIIECIELDVDFM